MRYSKLINDQYTLPETLEKIIFDSGASVPKNSKARIEFVKSLGFIEVKESEIPIPPDELNGKCMIKLGIPVMSETGILVRTYNFIPLSEEQLAYIAVKNKAKRDELLRSNVDSMNPIRWDSLSKSKKAEWINYRQALLDVPDQVGFPANIVWPKIPE